MWDYVIALNRGTNNKKALSARVTIHMKEYDTAPLERN
jgi:hypothetical protein